MYRGPAAKRDDAGKEAVIQTNKARERKQRNTAKWDAVKKEAMTQTGFEQKCKTRKTKRKQSTTAKWDDARRQAMTQTS